MFARCARAISRPVATATRHVALPPAVRCISTTPHVCAENPSGASSDAALSAAGRGYGSTDSYFDKARLSAGGQEEKRASTYFLLGGAKALYASAARIAIIRAVTTMTASADVLALASLEVDVSSIPAGQTVTVKWRGKPVFIRHRSPQQVEEVSGGTPAGLRDPADDAERTQKPDWLIVMGICTHLGCVPMADMGDYGGWFCPCHASHYDGSGRIRQGPAPLNLEVPPYKFIDDNTVLLG